MAPGVTAALTNITQNIQEKNLTCSNVHRKSYNTIQLYLKETVKMYMFKV